MVTLRPRAVSNCPRLDAVSPLPSEEATPPVTNTCLVVRACKEAPRGVTNNPCALPLPLAPFVAGLPACRSTGFHANTASGARAQQTRRSAPLKVLKTPEPQPAGMPGAGPWAL